MAKLNFGGVEEQVVTRAEFTLEKAKEFKYLQQLTVTKLLRLVQASILIPKISLKMMNCILVNTKKSSSLAML